MRQAPSAAACREEASCGQGWQACQILQVPGSHQAPPQRQASRLQASKAEPLCCQAGHAPRLLPLFLCISLVWDPSQLRGSCDDAALTGRDELVLSVCKLGHAACRAEDER